MAQPVPQSESPHASSDADVATEPVAALDPSIDLEAIFKYSPAGIALVDSQQRIVRANPALAEMLGYTVEELTRLTVPQITVPEDWEAEVAIIKAGLSSSAGKFRTDKRYLHKDGTVVWGDVTATIVTDASGQRFTLGIVLDITARKNAEKLLSHNEERFRLLYERAPIGYQSLDVDGRFLEVNGAWLTTLGYERHEVVGRWFGDFLTPPYREAFAHRFPCFKREGQIRNIEFEMVRKDGRIIIVSFDGLIGKSSQGEFRQTHCVLVDITQRREAESRLRYQAQLLEQIRDAVIVTDLNGIIQNWNPAAEQIFGYTATEVIGRHIDLLYFDQDKEGFRAQIAEPVIQKRAVGFIARRRHKLGHEVMINLSLSALHDEAGKVVGIIGCSIDITERFNAEAAIRQSEAKYRQLFESSISGLAVHEPILSSDNRLIDYRYLDVNPAFETFTGLRREDVVGKTVREILPDLEPYWIEQYEPVVLRGEPVHLENFAAPLNRYFEVIAFRNTPGQFVTTFTDVTQRRQSLEALQKSEEHYRQVAESNRRLLNEVNHRVRNNLGSLLSLVSLIQARTTDVPSFAASIESRVMGMARAHDLLVEADWGDIDLQVIISRLLQSLQHIAPHNVTVRVSGPALPLDPQHSLPLAMSVLQLFTNSFKYGAHRSPTGSIEIVWALQGEDPDQPVVELNWIERGGPPINGPIKPSLGTELIQGFLRHQLGGQCELRFPSEGVHHTLRFPLSPSATQKTAAASGE